MIDIGRFSINRIISPGLSLAQFYDFAVSVGIHKVELRNDLGGTDPIDGLKAADAAKLAVDKGVTVVSINALQKFNLASGRSKATAELGDLIALSKAIGCKAIVLCPNNEANDGRNQAQRLAETVDSLKAFGQAFVATGLLGLVEPLGFGISSLASLLVAQDAIRNSGFSCYRIVHDTFHHYIGPDTGGILGSAYDIAHTGLVHVSGVESDIATSEYRDAHRILVGPADRMKSREQILQIDGLGYKGDYSFEPFSPAVQKMGLAELTTKTRQSLEYLLK
jgi:2-keto-myo-inositol isomerase